MRHCEAASAFCLNKPHNQHQWWKYAQAIVIAWNHVSRCSSLARHLTNPHGTTKNSRRTKQNTDNQVTHFVLTPPPPPLPPPPHIHLTIANANKLIKSRIRMAVFRRSIAGFWFGNLPYRSRYSPHNLERPSFHCIPRFLVILISNSI